MPTDQIICRYCNKAISGTNTRCTKCNGAYHPSCGIRSTTTVQGVLRCCSSSRPVSPVDPGNTDLLSVPAASRDILESKIDKLSELLSQTSSTTQKKIDKIDKKICAMEVRLNELSGIKKDVEDLKTRITCLEAAAATSSVAHTADQLSVDSLISEIEDRFERAHNVLWHNFQELSQAGEELRQVNEILQSLNIERAYSVRRLGTLRSDKPRPLLVRLPNKNAVSSLFHSRNKLPSGVTLSRDRTPAQREKLTGTLRQIEQHNTDNPTRPVMLKYVKGVPTMVDKAGPSTSGRDSGSFRGSA